MINPAEIPQIPGNMGALSQHADAVTGVGTALPATGAKVHSTWQGLAPVYSAPESAQLFAATGPVQSVSASVGEDLTAVGGALSTYSTEVAAIKSRLDLLRTQAVDFVADANADEDWRSDQGKVDAHNQLLSDVNGAVADFMDAQRRCANTILARYSDKRYTAENGDGTITDSEFGYTKDVLDAALAQDGVPWGKPEEHDRGFLGDVGAFFVGIKDGGVGFVQGLGGLIGYGEGGWSWSNAGTAWKGLGIFALSLSAPLQIANQFTDLPGLPKGTLSTTLLNVGKGLIAYDTWKEDKSKAAGEATFNIVSAIVGTKGAGAGLRGAGAAAEASRFATVAKLGSGAVKAGEFITKIPKVSDVVLGTIKKFPGFKLPNITLPHTDIPTTHIDAPHVEVPGGHTPSGASVADGVGGGHALPPGATITNHGVVPGHGFDAPAPHVDPGVPIHDGVIGGRPHVETPAAPAPHGADAPPHAGHDAQPLPPGATITDKGVVPGHGGPAADSGTGIHIDENGVIRPGSHVEAPATPHGADAPATPAPHGAETPVAPAPHGADAPVTPAPHGSETPATAGSHGADAPVHDAQPLPAGATITDKGVVPGTHGGPLADSGAGIHIDENGVIRPGPAPHADAPAPHGADAPAHDAQPLPAGATITDKGVVPGTHGGPLADSGAGIHIDENGVIRPGPHAADAPAPHGAEAPARADVPAERELVPSAAGGGHGTRFDNAAGGGHGLDTPNTPVHGGSGAHAPETPTGRPPEAPTAHPHDPSGHDPGGRPVPHDPTTPHDPNAHDPGTHDPATHDGGTHDGADGHHSTDGTHAGPTADGPTAPVEHPFADPPPKVTPGTHELGVIPEARLGRGPSGLIDTIDGRPVNDVLHDIGQQRAEGLRARDGFSKADAGPVNAVAIDRQTGQVFEGSNGRPEDVIPADDLHPLLKQRLEEMRGTYDVLDKYGNPTGQTREFPHPDLPLRHAEVKAVNELLWRRGPDVDASVFGELRVDNFRLFDKNGISDIPCCANCGRLLAGTPSNAGKVTGFPPKFFDFHPE